MPRRFLVGGNWKLHGSRAAVDALAAALHAADLPAATDVVVAPPAPYLAAARAAFPASVAVAAQNVHHAASGAFTGEISTDMLLDLDVSYVILGHSERRALFAESNDDVAKKVARAVDANLRVILCCGESLQEREAGRATAVVDAQLEAVRQRVPIASDRIVIAYEPVWAIGTGKVASLDQAQEMHAHIRAWLAQHMGADAANTTLILYGGSVKAANCRGLAQQPDVDGFLVGGASLNPQEFIEICRARAE